MRSFFRLLLLALVLATVALVSALTAMRLAIHGREVVVPDVAGKTSLEARKAAEQAGLLFAMERQYYSATVPEGKIITQLPAAGTQVRRGWQLRVAESLGPQRVAIPDVLGDSQRAAEINIRRRGLDVGAVAEVEMPGTPAGQVLSQSPPANASGIAAPTIGLLVAAAPQPPSFVMPSFIGQPIGSVAQIVQDAGMRIGVVTLSGAGGSPFSPPMITTPQASAASLVVAQSPAPGQRIFAGNAINFQVR